MKSSLWRFVRVAVGQALAFGLAWAAENLGIAEVDPRLVPLIGAAITAAAKYVRDYFGLDKLPV